MHLTGTLIKNYFHCKRHAYLYYYGLNFRSKIIRIGEIMHEEQKPHVFVFEKVKIDDIKGDTLIEYKKSSANLKGTRYQVLYYLDYFQKKGLKLKGLIKDLTYKQQHIIELNEKSKQDLYTLINDIKTMLSGPMPKKLKLRKNCKGCSFFDYCWL